MQCNTYLSLRRAREGALLSQVASVTPLRIIHPSIGGKQKLFVRRFVKGCSDESNEALIPFLQAVGFLGEVHKVMNNCSWAKSPCVNKQKT